ncbi:MAG: imidazole glycerol phosphate synthase subunit HisH [Actinomycetota bacterium]|nr:imidazole glycerol phosphate synthase subunit HisH [Actinomycetota bacterium]
MTRVAVIDHGAGNLVSMVRALERVGAAPTLVDQGSLKAFDAVVLPGVGATGPAMRTLNRAGLSAELRSFEGPLLGVCVGMQLLFESSSEDDTECLGLFKGKVESLEASPLPHIGWNSVVTESEGIFGSPASEELFYFVHSFAARPDDDAVVTAWTTYGKDRFASVVATGHVTGVQFHPERSGDAGLDLLTRFVATATEARHVA